MEISGIFPNGEKEVEIVKLAFIATDGECKTNKSQLRHRTNAGKDVLKVFETAIKEQSVEPVRNYLIEKISQLAEVTYESEKNYGKMWLQKAEFMTWIETMKHLNLNTASLADVEQDVTEKCGMNDIDEVKGAFMFNENLVMSAICDIMTVEQIEALWKLCSTKEELEMVPIEKNAKQINFEAVGMKELTFFYIIRCLELKGKFNTLFTDCFLEYIEEIREIVGHQEKLDQVCKILDRYEIRVKPVGYCLVFCMIKDRKGAETEIDNIQEVFGKLLGFKVNVVVNPNKKAIEDVVDQFSKAPFHSMFDSLVCWVLAHGDTENIYLANNKSLARNDFLKLFSKQTFFSKKPKLFFMAPCQGANTIQVDRSGASVDGEDMDTDMPVKSPPLSDTNYDILNLHTESDRLIAYATMPEHTAYRHDETGSIFVSFICEQIEALRKRPDSSINVEDILKKTARKMQRILFKDKETQGLGKQICYYESTLQKHFLFQIPRDNTK